MVSKHTQTDISSSEWMEVFETVVWSKLTERQRQKLCKRFTVPYNTNDTSQLIAKHLGKKVLPFSFAIAAMHKAKSHHIGLLHANPDKKTWADKITYDKDRWGALRKHKTHYGILKQSFIDKATAHRFEQLLKSSISLDTNEKLKVLGASSTLSEFQITELIRVWEEKMGKWHELFLTQRSDIRKLVKKTEREWQLIEKNLTHFINTDSENIAFDKNHHLIPKSIRYILEKSIKGQTEAVTKVATLLYYHNKIHYAMTSRKKLPFPPMDPVLISGATGSGKSFMLQTGCDLMGIPYLHVDSSSLVSAGIRGYTISDMLKDLLRKTHYKRPYAESAVIFFDEIDKLLSHHDGASILHQLLRLVEGTEFPIDKTQEETHEFRSIKSLSTKNILFVFAGSFQSLIDQKSRQSGFITDTSEKDVPLQQNDIEKTELPKELLGRIGDMIVLQKLSKDDLRSILLHSDHSPLNKYQKMLQSNGLSLDLSDEDIEAIVDKASQSSYGARALNQALKPYVNELLFEVPKAK